MSPQGIIYLLHFDTPFKHAKHYKGFTTNLEQRMKEHGTGRGARLMEVIHAAGITWQLAATWNGTKRLERQIKNRGGAAKLCPICKGSKH